MLQQALRGDITLMFIHHCEKCWSYQFLHAMHFLEFCASPFSFASVESCIQLRFSEENIVTFLAQRALTFCSPSLPPTSLPRCPHTCLSEWVTGFTYRFGWGEGLEFLPPI
jgi:hypothetical protein